MNKNRLEAFSDGVFAIAITLLVLEIRPEVGGTDGWVMFLHVWPKVLIFALSFVLVGVYWVAHHNMLHFVERTDRGFLWLNLLLLLVVAFIPFPAALLGATGADAGSIRVYCGTLAATNLAGALMWMHATRGHRLVHPALPVEFAAFVTRILLAPVAVYIAAAVLAGFWRIGSLALVALVPLFFILPNPSLDRLGLIAHAAIAARRN
jgi:uncharacterized membrane protein